MEENIIEKKCTGGKGWIPASILGIAMIIAFASHGYLMGNRTGNNVITVTGSAKESVKADLAKWSASFTRHSGVSNLKESLALANGDTQKIKQFIIDFGIPETSITLLPIQTETVYEMQKGEYMGVSQNVSGYNIRQEVRVEDKDIAKVDLLAKNLSKLVDSGIISDYQYTGYYFTKLDSLRPNLFAEATKDAKVRAEAIAKGTGAKVGFLRSAKTGIIQVLAPNSTDVSDYGTYDLSTKDKEISATVSVSFELK